MSSASRAGLKGPRPAAADSWLQQASRVATSTPAWWNDLHSTRAVVESSLCLQTRQRAANYVEATQSDHNKQKQPVKMLSDGCSKPS